MDKAAVTHTHTHTHRYNKIFSSSKQKKETLQFAATWLDFEDIVLRERQLLYDLIFGVQTNNIELIGETGGWQRWERWVKVAKM